MTEPIESRDTAAPTFEDGYVTFTALPAALPVWARQRLIKVQDDPTLRDRVERELRAELGVLYSRKEFRPINRTII